MVPITTYDEKELTEGLMAGTEAAFTTIYELYSPSLTNFAAARLSSLDEAKDIIHDLFVYLWEEREQIRITHSLKAFLFSAVRYRIIDHIRHNITRRKHADSIMSLTEVDTAGVEHSLSVKGLQETINNAVKELTPRVKEVFKLSRDQQLSITEIAYKLNLSPQTVKNQLTTALSFLRSAIQKFMILII